MLAVVEVLLPVFLLIVIGVVVRRLGWLDDHANAALARISLNVLMAPLLFRSTATMDVGHVAWGLPLTYFVVAMVFTAALYAWQRQRGIGAIDAVARTLAGAFSNSVMIGIPVVQLAWGDEALALLLTVVAFQSLVLLTPATIIAELAVARGRGAAVPADPPATAGQPTAARSTSAARAVVVASTAAPSRGALALALATARRALIHPVVLPILAGLAFGGTGWSLPAAVDRTMAVLGSAGPTMSLILLGATLAYIPIRAGLAEAAPWVFIKLVVYPVVMYLSGRFLFGLPPEALAVATIAAAMPAGNNAYLFAQHYHRSVPVVTTVVAVSTFFAAGTLGIALTILH